MMAHEIEVIRNFQEPPGIVERGQVDAGPLQCLLLDEPDASDPLNVLGVLCLKIGRRFAIKLTYEPGFDPKIARARRDQAMAAMVAAAVEYAAEIRDAIAVEKAG